MAGVRIGLVCDQLCAPPPASCLVGVSCERRLGLPWLYGHALQSGTWQVRVPRLRYDVGDAYQPELVCFAGDSDSLLLAESSLVWNLDFLMVFPFKTRLRETPSFFAGPRSATRIPRISRTCRLLTFPNTQKNSGRCPSQLAHDGGGRSTVATSSLHSKLRSEANGRRELVTSLGCDIHAAPKPMLATFRLRVLSRLRFLVLDLRIGNSTF